MFMSEMKKVNHAVSGMDHEKAMVEIDRLVTGMGVEAFYEALMENFYPHIYAHLMEEEV